MVPLHIPRRASRVDPETKSLEPKLLSDWRDLDAYVLLGDPGSGKSSVMEEECKAVGGLLLKARNVVAGITRGIDSTTIAGRTVFIDGLDEVRAGAIDGKTNFDVIRKWLLDQGCPRFRLSCREADWSGNHDRKHLEEIALSETVTELHLEPLSDKEVQMLLEANSSEISNPDGFYSSLKDAGLTELLGNPLLLGLIVKAAGHGARLTTRKAIYELACEQLAREVNDEHLEAQPRKSLQTLTLLHDAGLLCAILLLSGQRGVATVRAAISEDTFWPFDLQLIWSDLPAALASKVFTTVAQLAEPRHRTIAEYLGGQALAKCVRERLPLKRVLALMQGQDGMPINSLRGLWAWLAVHFPEKRDQLVSLDPLGFVLNGDVAELGLHERISVLKALQRAAKKDPSFLSSVWTYQPFGPLARADMAHVYEELLRDPNREREHLSFMDCVLGALQHGQAMPSLGPALKTWVESDLLPSTQRVDAYHAWKHCAGFSPEAALRWLQAIRLGELADNDDELGGALLRDLYPVHLRPEEVLDHWHEPKDLQLIGTYLMFWKQGLWAKTPNTDLEALCKAWLRLKPTFKTEDLSIYETPRLASKLLAQSLKAVGDDVSDNTLYEWLGIGLDDFGSSRLELEDRQAVRDWLSARPKRMKAVGAIALAGVEADKTGRWNCWQAHERLHGAPRPRDWLFWLLEQASTANTPELAEFCFVQAAHAAVEPTTDLDNPSMEQIESWVVAHGSQWPEASQWLENAWAVQLDHYKAEQNSREKRYQTQQAAEDEKRRLALAPHLPALLAGTAPPGLLFNVAVAYLKGFSNIKGETPQERVQQYLGSNHTTAQAVIDAFPLVLGRSDLPTVVEALNLAAKDRQHFIRPAALLAAKLVHEQDANAPLHWPQDLAQRLVAYYLTDGTGDMPAWYHRLAEHRPEWVAPVLTSYAQAQFKRKDSLHVTGLWSLGRETQHAQLARLALPELLQAVPLVATPAMRDLLNRSLLSALSALDRDVAAKLVLQRLDQSEMDDLQRIAWLVADLPYRADAAADLVALVNKGSNERRAVALGEALHEQGVLKHLVQRPDPDALRQLVDVLAPITPAGRDLGGGWVTDAQDRGDTVRGLLFALSSNPSSEAKEALLRLAQTPGLGAWSDAIQYSLRSQATTAREASFHVPDAATVAQTLANQAPANPADLRALVMDHLEDRQNRWRGRNTFALKIFWNTVDRKPKIENDCRDLLLDLLLQGLEPLNISIEREHSAARDKRIDMCAVFMSSGRRIALPIEVKKEDHDKLWTAWRDQLQHLYTIDPDAQGYGLYLVLWFGVNTRRHPDGLKVSSANELKEALENRIPAADRHRLMVQVLDLSWPVDPA